MILLKKSKWNRKQGDIGSAMGVESYSIVEMRKAEAKLELLRYQDTEICISD